LTAWDPPPPAPDRRRARRRHARRPPPAARRLPPPPPSRAPPTRPPRRSPSQSFKSSPHSCFGRPAAAASPDGSPQQREAARSRANEREREIDLVVKPRGRTLYLHETYRITVSCTFWEKEPEPPYTKEWGKGGTCTTSTRVATTKTPPKHPNPQNTPPNTPQNTQSFECRACAFMLFGRPGGRAARCPDGSAEAAFEAARERPTLKPRARGLYSYTKHPFLAPFGSRSPDPPILKSERIPLSQKM
jgi:hypothetical protein